MLVVNDVFKALKEPLVNLGKFKQAVDGVAFLQRLRYGEGTHIGRICQFVVEVVKLHVLIAHEAVHTLTYRTQTLLNDFFKCAANRHDFAHRLHA